MTPAAALTFWLVFRLAGVGIPFQVVLDLNRYPVPVVVALVPMTSGLSPSKSEDAVDRTMDAIGDVSLNPHFGEHVTPKAHPF